jgi:hypothetical protein
LSCCAKNHIITAATQETQNIINFVKFIQSKEFFGLLVLIRSN